MPQPIEFSWFTKKRTPVIANQSDLEQFMTIFAAGDVESAASFLDRQPAIDEHHGYAAHPWLREFVERNNGHCYKPSHMQIADMLLPNEVRAFRDSVVSDRLEDVSRHLQSDAVMVHAEFTAGRGIARAIHHWKSVGVAKRLVAAGASLNQLTTRGESPLTMQMRFGTVEGVRFLLDSGADPNVGIGGHMLSEHLVEMIELLLAHGWDINRGQLLHDAKHGFGSRVKTWLAYGADPNIRNAEGQTALHLIATRGTGRDAIGALVQAGADIHARDEGGYRPLDLAQEANTQVATRVLISLGAEGGSS